MDRNNNSLSGRTFFLLQEWRKMALLMEIRLQKNEKRNNLCNGKLGKDK